MWLPSNVNTSAGDMSQFGPNAPGYTWVHANDVPSMRPFPGITVKLLWEGDNGAKAVITEIQPGAVWGKEDHHSPVPEEVYVISGVLNDGVNDYPAAPFCMHRRVHGTCRGRSRGVRCSSSTPKARNGTPGALASRRGRLGCASALRVRRPKITLRLSVADVFSAASNVCYRLNKQGE
jgi:hypothetical protein